MDQSKSKSRRGMVACAPTILAFAFSGCIVDDGEGHRGQANAPTATVPDSGSPIRRETPSKTLNDADPETTGDATLEVK
jgi:hypothetical protein